MPIPKRNPVIYVRIAPMNRATPLSLIISLALVSILQADQIRLVFDETAPQANYAAQKLSTTLQKLDHQSDRGAPDYDYLISLSVDPNRLPAEGFSIMQEGEVISVMGGDHRGMIYGALALAEKLRNGESLHALEAVSEKPDQQFRGIKFNLPWETYRPSSALDQHIDTAKDIHYWEAFLDMMVENRLNIISLWNMHPYTFMVKPKNFPEASPWSEQEQEAWQTLYHGIFQLAKERALDTYIVHWNIFVNQAFAEAHGVAKQNFYPHYYVPGDTSELVKQYMRESVTQVLETYPNLDGIGISHGEGMAGMTPLQRQEWVDEVIIPGMLQADRKVKLIHRVPFSSGLGSEGGTSKNVEVVTRKAMEHMGNQFDGPIWVEMKFNWSHGHSTPKLEKVHGGHLGDTYFDPLPSNYKIVWQVRNEDFFALRWGVPNFIRQHIALNGKASYTGGYFVGSETYIPALDYFTALDHSDQWTWSFERQWLFYKLWGRLLYNPETPDEVFEAEFQHRYGTNGKNLLAALSLASNTQLRLASLYNCTWDFTLYSEGFLALQGETTRYISVDALTNQPTNASEYVNVADFVAKSLKKEGFTAGTITPDILADSLERDNQQALALIDGIDANQDTALKYELADIQIWAHLGLHLAEKLRGAIALETYRTTDDPAQQEQAITHLQRALDQWDEVIRISRPLYRDMPLTHYNHNSFDANDDNLFHWALIRDEVAADVEIAKRAKVKD